MDTSSPRFSQQISRLIIGVVIAVLIAAMLVFCLFTRVSVDGHSMNNVLDDSDVVLINRVSYSFTKIRRYDIVYFSYGEGNNSIKRVIGLPGEDVLISGGNVYINGEIIDTSFSLNGYNVAGLAEYTISLEDDEYFLLGDNGDSSEDSRFDAVGNIKRENIIGEVWFRVSPFAGIGGI